VGAITTPQPESPYSGSCRNQPSLSPYGSAIQIAKGGPKLKPPANPDAVADQEASNHGTEVTVTITTGTMAEFILGMQFFFDRPLVDQTGISGRHNFILRHTHDEANATDTNAPPGLFTAIQEQLGLKLDDCQIPHRRLRHL
jgi:uncharacterized protein (TIGR03435 family)